VTYYCTPDTGLIHTTPECAGDDDPTTDEDAQELVVKGGFTIHDCITFPGDAAETVTTVTGEGN
jgi:hypothetical protein